MCFLMNVNALTPLQLIRFHEFFYVYDMNRCNVIRRCLLPLYHCVDSYPAFEIVEGQYQYS